ncbi:hypothetical protein HPB50_026924 [Hyalomma asiaticum]|uniref:Uncharacterized protein n=1 Tax=Hyalomma asiaticum TaxID=266040 RepID=A0ACB7T2X3_HYAAI|nr:hypothetical protein HPB50_026924 [Hyalomma asiaticum]
MPISQCVGGYAYIRVGTVACLRKPHSYSVREHLQICERSLTCCTQEMEHLLSAQSREEFERVLRDEIGKVRAKFAARMQRFDGSLTSLVHVDHVLISPLHFARITTERSAAAREMGAPTLSGGEFFKELLKTSKKDFHGMFLRTYGMQYDTNSYIFHDMFDQLEKYYRTGGVDLVDALDGFFLELYRKMFQVMNTQYALSERYLQCVSDHRDELRPFGDVPQKLTLEVKRSFVATRTFVQALAIGRDVIQSVMELYDKCGKLRLARRGSGQELHFETLKFGGASGGQQSAMRPTTAAGTSMDRLVQGIKKQIRATRSMWSQLPDRMCRQPSAQSPPPEEECWDGLNRAKSEGGNHTVVGGGKTRGPHQQFHQQTHSGHRGGSTEYTSSNVVINQLILTLKIITNKLNLAYGGHDVQWQDAADLDDMGSGSGSGSGDDEYEPAPTSTTPDIFFTGSLPTSGTLPKHPVTPHTSSAHRVLCGAPLWLLVITLLLKKCLSNNV